MPVTTQTRFETVASGKADMECGSSTVTLGRMKEVDFSNFVFVESTGLAVKPSAGINALRDTVGKRIAVVAGTSNERALAALTTQGDRSFSQRWRGRFRSANRKGPRYEALRRKYL